MKNSFLTINLLLCLVVITTVTTVSYSHPDTTNHSLPLYEEQPDTIATLFGEGTVSTGLGERDIAISPDGKTLIFTVWGLGRGTLSVCYYENNEWSLPELMPFSGQFSDLEPFFSLTDKKLYFVSNRPNLSDSLKVNYDIWYVEYDGKNWGKPVNLGPPVNSAGDEFYPSLTKNNHLYFTSVKDNGVGNDDIYRSRFIDGQYTEVELLGTEINSESYEFNAFISPDEDYLIYTTYGRPGILGSGDLFINFRTNNDEWSDGLPMGETVNSPSLDYCPYVTSDGKFLFLTSRRTKATDKFVDYDSLKEALGGAGNGNNDIFWLKTDIIEELRKKATWSKD